MFESAKLKIERADQDIADLERHLITFTEQNFQSSLEHRDFGPFDLILRSIAPPPILALIIGDAVHNLWTAMDHLMWELAGPDCQQSQLYFPKGRDCQSFKATCGGIKTPSSGINDILKSLEVCPDGIGRFLYITCCLDRADKHNVLTPVVHAPTINELVLISNGGNARRNLSDL